MEKTNYNGTTAPLERARRDAERVTQRVEMRAVLVSARLEIRLQYPADLLAQIDADNAAIDAAMRACPEWARAAGAPHRDLNPIIHKWIDELEPSTLGDEFARKAKKIGLTIPTTDLHIQYDMQGITVSKTATGRA
jgi:hypothetical protein